MSQDKQPFVPYKPEEKVVVQITKREASLIQRLRRYAFGEFTITKYNGLIIHLLISDRQKIEEDDKIDSEMLR